LLKIGYLVKFVKEFHQTGLFQQMLKVRLTGGDTKNPGK